MKKIFEIIKKVLLSERLYKIILDISIVLLFGLSIFMLFVQSNIWTKIIMIGYSISIMIIIVFLRMPSILTETKFKKTSIWSFFTWNVCYSVIAGIIIGCIIGKLKKLDIIQSSIIATSVVTIIIAMLWFIYQIRIKEDNTAELDLYSSIIVAVLTFLSLALDYSSEKVPFLIIFFFYLVIQIMIKVKICKIKTKH